MSFNFIKVNSKYKTNYIKNTKKKITASAHQKRSRETNPTLQLHKNKSLLKVLS